MKQIKKYILCACLTAVTLLVGEGVMWGGDTYYARGTITVKSTGNGTAYISKTTTIGTDTSVSFDQNEDDTSAPTISISATAYLKAVPNTNYHFVKWLDGSTSGTPIGTTADGQQYSHTFSITANSTNSSSPTTVNQDVYAIFEENFKIGLTVQSNNTSYGTVSATAQTNDNSETASENRSFTLNATPKANCHFVSWTKTDGDAYGSISGNTFTGKTSSTPGGTNPYTVTGTFAENFYAKITPSHDGHGSDNPTVTSTNPQNSDTPNTDLTFTVSAANAASGYHFDNWEVTNGTSTTSTSASPLTVTVKSAKTGGSTNATNCQVKAVYAQNYYADLTANVMTGASGTASATPKTSNNTATSGGDIVFNITAPDAIAGYHWDGWKEVTGVTIGDKTKQSTTATVAASTTPGGTASYSIVAKYAINHYVRVNTAKNISEGGTAYVCYGDSFSGTETSAINGNGKGWQGAKETFSVMATPASGYHFVNWSITGDGTITDNTSASTTVIGKTKAGNTGADNPYIYTVTANFAQNIYYAKLTATSGGNGTASVTEATKSTTTQSENLTFNITATPNSGYHFVKWTTTGAGTFGSATSASTTFTAPASANYDEANAASYTVTAEFAIDQFGAQLTTGISTLNSAGGSTAQVSSDNSSWSSNKSVAKNTANTDVTFYVKATPATGYEFIGWSTSQSGSSTVSGLGATGTYVVKSAATQGQTNSANLYAIFRPVYNIIINATGTSSTDRIVFNVTGPANYRVSVPVGGSITLKDVASGEYTITPEGSWSWAYTVSPTEGTTSFDSENKSTHNFTVNAKSSTKKHDEVVNVIEP